MINSHKFKKICYNGSFEIFIKDKMMKVSLKNVGMLDEAEFEVGDLTIICGENNTGKTYATYSLYGYLDFMRSIRDDLFYMRDRTLFEDEEIQIENNVYKITYEKIKTRFEKHIDKKSRLYSTKYLVEYMAGNRDNFLDTEFNVNFDITIEDVKKSIKIYLETDSFNINARQDVNHIVYDDGLAIQYRKNLSNSFLTSYLHNFFDALLNISLNNNFILSVERTGASIFQSELDFIQIAKFETAKKMLLNEKVNLFDMIRTLKLKQQTYPKPVRDNIDTIRNIKSLSKQYSLFKEEKNQLHNFIILLMGKITGGKYKATDAGILFQPKGSKQYYPIEIASSSVRSLLMLNYYILNVAQKGDILMIDEPELNLHPSNQILMGRLIALLVNAGIKVFITTHSDYIVREISNCIILNQLKNEQIATHLKRYDYNENYRLDYKKVKAYIAKYDKKSKKNTRGGNCPRSGY